jgi:Tol biopolymer transport system component
MRNESVFRRLSASTVAVLIVLGSGTLLRAEESAPGTPTAYDESDFLTRTQRLTYEGRRAGEGYFSPDGTKLVFQSEREEGNPFYQIYLMDLLTGDTERISPGIGKTTCSFIRPGTGDVLFGSTHLDPDSERLQREELDFRASGRERRYSWDYDPAMDIFVADAETGELSRLTEEYGYDAEASYSPDGEWIVYSSMRDAYERELTEEEKKILEVNPSYFGELYMMRADGSEKRRLTDVPGYDGGPFFSTDGERVVWRRFSEDGLTADVYTINTDGTDEKRITDFGALSWAPYEHPSEEYILFASNKLGFSNFEIFLVDVEGTKEPVRITYTDGFDGLPVPSPDGKILIWTSSRHGEGGQLYRAVWNHEAAMKALAASPPRKTASE